jgi:hypothetical protein
LKKEIGEYTRMERPPMLMSQQNKYCKNDHITKDFCRFSAIPIKIPVKYKKAILKFMWNHR